MPEASSPRSRATSRTGTSARSGASGVGTRKATPQGRLTVKGDEERPAKVGTEKRPPAKPRGLKTDGTPRQAPRTSLTSFRRDGKSGRGRLERDGGERGSGRARDAGRGRSQRDNDRGSSRGRDTGQGRPERDVAPEVKGPKHWGSVTRKGAGNVKRSDLSASSREEERSERKVGPSAADEWVRDDKPKAKSKSRSTTEPFRLPDEAVNELKDHVGSPKRLERVTKQLKDAAKAYAGERWTDARRSLRPVLAEAGEAPVVRELNGMLSYRQGKWAAAIKELESAHLATQSYDLYPALMDSYRALKKHDKVAELWEELREASPGPDVMAEGRIVAAESMATKSQLPQAITLLEKSSRPRAKVQTYHLRTWYVLGDLYDRAGDAAKARVAFQRVADRDPELGDVMDRLAALD